MIFLRKIAQNIERFYRRCVVVEQYPMLTSICRNKLMKEGALGVVYMMHHISEKDPNRIPTNEDLKVSPSFLEKIILKYKREGFDFISLDQLYSIMMSVKRPDKPFVVFTIDDGYLDNYTNALPIFEKYHVPFAIFVATDFVDKKAILWWDSLENLILTHDEIIINTKERFSCRTFQERWDTFRILRERILCLDQNHLREELISMFSDYEIDWFAPVREKGMSWDQVRELSRHPLCTIGGHTISHPALNKLSLEDAKREIKDGIIKIMEQIQKDVSNFAYPYGTPHEIGDREFQIVNDLGIKMAFMAHQGCVTVNSKAFNRIPRVYLNEVKR
jgi:peptidoglycan/xylan/chitin deacetylase (PgdA/CDA1 family)